METHLLFFYTKFTFLQQFCTGATYQKGIQDSFLTSHNFLNNFFVLVIFSENMDNDVQNRIIPVEKSGGFFRQEKWKNELIFNHELKLAVFDFFLDE